MIYQKVKIEDGNQLSDSNFNFSPNGKHIISVNELNQIIIWDTGNGKVLYRLSSYDIEHYNIIMSYDSNFIASSHCSSYEQKQTILIEKILKDNNELQLI
jgi:WD40 repeat protein